MKNALRALLGTEVYVLFSTGETWYSLTPVSIDEVEDIVYFKDITDSEYFDDEDDDRDDSIFWELAIRIAAVVGINKKVGQIPNDIERFISILNGEDSNEVDEGD